MSLRDPRKVNLISLSEQPNKFLNCQTSPSDQLSQGSGFNSAVSRNRQNRFCPRPYHHGMFGALFLCGAFPPTCPFKRSDHLVGGEVSRQLGHWLFVPPALPCRVRSRLGSCPTLPFWFHLVRRSPLSPGILRHTLPPRCQASE